MTQSPGHRKWPDHKVQEKRLDKKIQVEVNGELIAETNHAIEVDEDNYPPRYYIPPSDVAMDKLSGSNTTAECPFKGHGHYYNLDAGAERLDDVAWTYDDPYDEHEDLAEYVAFHDEMPEVRLSINPG